MTAALLPMLLLTGCGETMLDGPQTYSPAEVRQAAENMRTWPSLETTEQQVTTAIQQIADSASAINPTLQWQWRRDRNSSGTCSGAYEDTDGWYVTTQLLVSDTPIPDTDWPQILQSATQIARSFGMDQVGVLIDRPGHHDVSFGSPDGNTLRFATFKTAVLDATTGCRYKQADLDKPHE
ncbi:LppA family lipoprotein [Nocardia sp. NBC_01377]|uniref:LppA family lipoprotein n=1 Tax=Nocardia sp. NBC_01377 TaxID=2903595 RepID=UPI0038699FB3